MSRKVTPREIGEMILADQGSRSLLGGPAPAETLKRMILWGGGPSRFEHGHLAGVRTGWEVDLACNWSWTAMPHIPDFLLTADQAAMAHLYESWAFFSAGIPSVAVPHKFPRDRVRPGFMSIDSVEEEGYWPSGPDDPIRYGHNSGLSLLSLADAMGAEKIYLIGYDLGGDGSQAGAHRLFRRMFEEIAPLVRAEVVNCNPKSSLRCFPFRRTR